MQLYSRLATEFSIEPIGDTGLYLRDLVGTGQLLFIIREFYNLEGGMEEENHIRPYLLLVIKAYLTKVRVSKKLLMVVVVYSASTARLAVKMKRGTSIITFKRCCIFSFVCAGQRNPERRHESTP